MAWLFRLSLIGCCCGFTGWLGAAEVAPVGKGLGDPGKLQELRIEPGTGPIAIRGADARQQLIVTASYSSGQFRDHTRNVAYSVTPADVLQVQAGGWVLPLRDGQAVITARHADGLTATATIHVSGMAHQVPVNFNNQVVPIFTKLGCNSGGCHGKASGQNGFRLSLLGFYPEDDYEFLVKEGRGRRLFPASPGESLLLTKPVGRSPHGGGKRMEVDSHEYRVLHRWIAQGMPYGTGNDPVVTAIQCIPNVRVMDRNSSQQLMTLATYSDGTVEDVTRMALYEPNDLEMAEVNATGLVKTHATPGEVAIMARYQGQVATFRATIPLGADTGTFPEPRNFIDTLVFNKLKVLGIPASPKCDDATFIRRVSLDVAGKLPTEQEVRDFVALQDPAKRDKLIDQLLDSTAYADLFANKWNMVLRNKKRDNEDLPGTYAFYSWIRNSLDQNKPYNQFVGEVISASGDPQFNPPVVWYREVDQLNEQVEDVAQLFLGLRIQCARCHHHPFEKWSQNDYFSFAAFFSRIGKKDGGSPREKRIFHNEGVASAVNPRTNKAQLPAGLGGPILKIPADRDPRTQLVEWLSRKDNPFFAKSLVNRYWKHFFDRGIVEPEDDMRETNPPSNPELLQQLARHFIDSGFDLKQLVRTICQSTTYQLSSLPNAYNIRDKQNFSRYYPRRLRAEVLYDALHQVTSTTQGYPNLPEGTTALQLPDPSAGPYFLKVFGQPQADTACECERSQEANLAQSLHLLNSSEVQQKVSSGSGRAAQLANDKSRADAEKIRELYRWLYSREPDAQELSIAAAHITRHQKEKRIAYEDLLWVLINSKEFLFNH